MNKLWKLLPLLNPQFQEKEVEEEKVETIKMKVEVEEAGMKIDTIRITRDMMITPKIEKGERLISPRLSATGVEIMGIIAMNAA